jgi:hypothetical protein
MSSSILEEVGDIFIPTLFSKSKFISHAHGKASGAVFHERCRRDTTFLDARKSYMTSEGALLQLSVAEG